MLDAPIYFFSEMLTIMVLISHNPPFFMAFPHPPCSDEPTNHLDRKYTLSASLIIMCFTLLTLFCFSNDYIFSYIVALSSSCSGEC